MYKGWAFFGHTVYDYSDKETSCITNQARDFARRSNMGTDQPTNQPTIQPANQPTNQPTDGQTNGVSCRGACLRLKMRN
jgi:hypothetical protein